MSPRGNGGRQWRGDKWDSDSNHLRSFRHSDTPTKPLPIGRPHCQQVRIEPDAAIYCACAEKFAPMRYGMLLCECVDGSPWHEDGVCGHMGKLWPWVGFLLGELTNKGFVPMGLHNFLQELVRVSLQI
jgi:hypothetical protein